MPRARKGGTTQESMVSLVESQNPDGGWPYQRGGWSWTEPTAYAVLALMAGGWMAEPVKKGLRWLKAAQLPDGGWPAQPGIRQSGWVTAVATLPGAVALGESTYLGGIDWVVRQTGEDTNFLIRARQLITGNAPSDPGWPWFPGTSAWVTPTSLSMLALRKAARSAAARGANAQRILARLASGASYLLAHACRDGGWNHGAARVLDTDAHCYPETTGVALLAMGGTDSPEIRRACRRAQAQLPGCQSSEAESWLRLGLRAHGQLPPNLSPPRRAPRTIQNAALALLAAAAIQDRNPFLE